MKYMDDASYEYVMNKYHDQSQPFDSFSRFLRKDDYFTADTGLAPEKIYDKLREMALTKDGRPHPVIKAEAFAYILQNTRISCDKRDRFPAINMVDRPLNATIIEAWKQEVYHGIIADAEKKRAQLENDGIVTIWPDYDHSVPDFDRLLSLGFAGILRESEEARAKLLEKAPLTEDQEGFFDGIRITYNAIIDFLERLSSVSEEKYRNARMAKACKNLASKAPETFYEALMLNYIYFMLSEHMEGLQVRSLSNFDRLYAKFYRNDLNDGISTEELRTDLAFFLLQFTAIGNYWNQPVYLGGTKADGTSEVNAFSYVFLDVYDEMGIYNPKIQLKTGTNTPKEFVLKALDMIRRGHNSIVFVSDETVIKALMRVGATWDEARQCDIKGCYEYALRDSYETGMNYINLLKPMEYALNRGCDLVTGKFAGREAPEEYRNFEEFYEEYKKQLLFLTDQVIETVNIFEEWLSYVNPQNLLSATFPPCLEKGVDAMHGGAHHNSSTVSFGFLATMADSLTSIQKLVFDEKRLTLKEFTEILRNNYEGNELLRREILADKERYGNNLDRPDEFAREIMSLTADYVREISNCKSRGGRWNANYHIARQCYTQGAKTAATADGRLRGEELSKNITPVLGRNHKGITAAILTATKLDATAFCGDACLDAAIHPTLIKGDTGLEAFYAVVMTFIKRGGHALNLNVFDASVLRDAQEHPEDHQDLQIRVCGWNALFVNINKEEQDGFIRQAEVL